MASGIGDGDDPPVVIATITGASIVPPAPVALGWTAGGDGGATVRWRRRSRAGWRWSDGADAPLAEEREAYRVTIAAAGGVRTEETTAPAIALTAAERATGATVTVRQIGTAGASLPATITI